jgi:hypothetical protein
MVTFQPLNYKNRLKNAQHFAFIQAFITALQAAGFTATKITALLQELTAAFAEEDRWYMQTRASEIVAQRTAADDKRDRFYTRLHRLIQAWAGSGMAQLDDAATALIRPFDLYKVKTTAQIDEETGVLENLISDLSTTEMQAHLATVNGTYLFEQMVEGQNLVKSLRLEQGVEESEKVYGALSAARKTCDAIYDRIADIIESFSKVADDPAPYETFISHWNGTVKIYQDMLDRKSGSSTNGGGSNNGGGGSEDNGNNDNDNNNDNNGGGDNPTPNPTPDPNPNPNPGGGGDDDGADED